MLGLQGAKCRKRSLRLSQPAMGRADSALTQFAFKAKAADEVSPSFLHLPIHLRRLDQIHLPPFTNTAIVPSTFDRRDIDLLRVS